MRLIFLLLAIIPVLQSCGSLSPEERKAILDLSTAVAKDRLLTKPQK